MSKPQAGILPEPSEHTLFLIASARDRERQAAGIAAVVRRVPSLAGKVAALDRRAKLACTVGIGSELWDAVSPAKRPKGLRPFKAVEANGRSAPNTGGDLLLHLISKRRDLAFELAMRVVRELADRVEVMDEVHGFRYLDSRDLTGFIDGTENPKGRMRATVALIGDEDREFAAGSYVFTQRYVHDLKKWEAISVADQERAIGRRKRDSTELSAKTKPATAHISRVVIEEDGEELEIVRHSYPYGTVSESGIFFIAYTRDLTITEKMLGRMMGAAGDGLHDRLMDFTRAVSGATFFAPSEKVLKSLGRP